MKSIINRFINAFANKANWFFLFAIVLIWAKTFIVQRFVFDLPITSTFQEIIHIVSPLSTILLLSWFALLLARKRKNLAMVIVSFITSTILIANVVFYRFFNDFITLPVLFQTSNMAAVGNSASKLFNWMDLMIFADFIILLAILIFAKVPQVQFTRKRMATVLTGALVVFMVNLGMAEIVRPDLLTRTFDRNIMVKSIGTYNYHIYDIVQNSKTKTQKAFANSSGLQDAEKYMEQNKLGEEINSELFGVAKGRNVIVISLESLQSFVIGNRLFGKEVTPFLNDLIEDSFYFDNFYHQTGQGKTSDAEFMIDNSLYPLPSGSVYFTHAQNTYNSTPKILKDYGYYSGVFHANDKTFWNRDIMYRNLGYDRYFSKPDYVVTEETSVGWGLKDIEYMEQTVDLLETVPQPFYSRLLTLTNHHPFTLDEEDRMIPAFNSNSGTLNRYFYTVRYLDESIKVFFDELKESGLYENSIIVLYGDHYGISSNHNRAMSKYLGYEVTPDVHVDLQKVPFIVHIPGVEGETISKVAGQVDIRPTLLHLLGVDGKNYHDFGNNLFAEDRDPLVVLRDGSFITNEFVFTENTCYRKGNLTEEVETSFCEPYMSRAESELQYSDKIIYGDLLRFANELEWEKNLQNLPYPEDRNPSNNLYNNDGESMTGRDE